MRPIEQVWISEMSDHEKHAIRVREMAHATSIVHGLECPTLDAQSKAVERMAKALHRQIGDLVSEMIRHNRLVQMEQARAENRA